MKFKDSIYYGKKLTTNVFDPITGDLLIPAWRKLTKALVDRAIKAGATIPPSILHKPRVKKQKQAND